MRPIRSTRPQGAGHPFVFHLTEREKELLLATLQFYPQLDAGYYQLSRNPKTVKPADQEWLEETMEQQRSDHKKKLGQFLAHDERFFKASQGDLRFTLTGEQMEWMLRVLNDVRVGCWVRLGRPEMEAARKLKLNGAQARLFSAMELSGFFQTCLLSAFS